MEHPELLVVAAQDDRVVPPLAPLLGEAQLHVEHPRGLEAWLGWATAARACGGGGMDKEGVREVVVAGLGVGVMSMMCVAHFQTAFNQPPLLHHTALTPQPKPPKPPRPRPTKPHQDNAMVVYFIHFVPLLLHYLYPTSQSIP